MTTSRRKNKETESAAKLRSTYRRLLKAYGPQHWWPGESRFEIMVGAVLTQNTAWLNVERAIANLKAANALTPQAILAASPKRLASWLKPSGYFNVKAKRLRAFCRWLLARKGAAQLARVPTAVLRAEMLTVHGVGPETADDILLYAFERPVFVVDAYTKRVFTRLGVLRGHEGYESVRQFFESNLKTDVALLNEYHALIVRHGKDVCRVKPRCSVCCLANDCPSHSAG